MRQRTIKKKLFIFTNGEKTEIEYFDFYRLKLKNSGNFTICKPKFINGEPLHLIDLVVKEQSKNNLKNYNKKDDEIWLVFDVDDFFEDANKFTNLIALTKKNNFNLAWSNPSIETWFLLHFQDITSEILIPDCHKKLSTHLKQVGIDYNKNENNSKMFEVLMKNDNCAIENAKRNDTGDIKRASSTKIHEIIQKLKL